MADTILSLSLRWLRDFFTDKVPSSGPNEPSKREGRSLFSFLDSQITALQTLSSVTAGNNALFATEADITVVGYAAPRIGEVYNDPDPTKNTIRIKVGPAGSGSWTNTGILGYVGYMRLMGLALTLESWTDSEFKKIWRDSVGRLIMGHRQNGETYIGRLDVGGTVSGRLVDRFETEDDLTIFYPDGTVAEIYADPDPTKNTIRIKNGPSADEGSTWDDTGVRSFEGHMRLLMAAGSIDAWTDSEYKKVWLDSLGRTIMGHRQNGQTFIGQLDVGGIVNGSLNPLGVRVAHIVRISHSIGLSYGGSPVPSLLLGYGGIMFNRSVKTWVDGDHNADPQNRAANGFTLGAIAATPGLSNVGTLFSQRMAVELKRQAIGYFSPLDPNLAEPLILISNSSTGGRIFEDLIKSPDVYGHYATSVDDVSRARAAALEEGLSHAVVALSYVIGDENAINTVHRDTNGGALARGLFESEVILLWRNDLLTRRADYPAITRQSGTIPAFTYGAVIQGTRLPIICAVQLAACDQLPSLYATTPTYKFQAANNAVFGNAFFGLRGGDVHLDVNGDEWFGQMEGRVIGRVIIGREVGWQPCRPITGVTRAIIQTATPSEIVVGPFHAPNPPLRISDWLPPQGVTAQGAGYGFTIDVGTIQNVTIEPGGLHVRVKCSATVNAGRVITYGGSTLNRTITPVVAGTPTARGADIVEPEVTAVVPSIELFLNGFADDEVALFAEGDGHFYAVGATSGARLNVIDSRTITSGTILRGWMVDYTGTTQAQLTAAGVSFAELTGAPVTPGAVFLAGEAVQFHRAQAYGNIEDSCFDVAPYVFATGPRVGVAPPLAHPLWQFDSIVCEAET